MAVETTTTLAGLNPAWPLGTDPKSEGDDHIRLIKSLLKTTFPATVTADIGFGVRNTPDRFVWNDKADLTGNDVMSLDEKPVLSLKSPTATPPAVRLIGSTTPQLEFDDATPRARAQIYSDLVTNKLAATVWNAAGTQLHSGEILTTGNSPSSLTASGYQKLASGLIIQWGTATSNASGDAGITFPTAFPANLASVTATANVGAGQPAADVYLCQVCNLTTGGCSVQTRKILANVSSAWASGNVKWIAMGY